MKKIYAGMVVLLLLALIPFASAGSAVAKTTGGGWFGDDLFKMHSTWTAQMDGQGNVKGQAEAHHAGAWDTFHVDITSLIVNGQYAYIGGIVTQNPDIPELEGTEMCMCIYDGGKEEPDRIDGWYYGSNIDAAFCQSLNSQYWWELYGGNAKVF